MGKHSKSCFKCKTSKPISEFYKHRKMWDGHLNKCKECTKLDVRKNYASNRSHYLEYEKKRMYLPHRIRAREDYKKTEKGRLAKKRAIDNWNKSNPTKVAAQKMVKKAIKDGTIMRLPCVKCGKPAHAHHEDYSKPLIVMWLCPGHHSARHKEIKKGISLNTERVMRE